MKQDFPQLGIAVLCRLFGKTRHAYYDSLWRKEDCLVKEDVILQEVASIRKELPRLGTRKLHYMLQNKLSSHQIQLGRDYLFDLLAEHKLLVRQRKRRITTTDSRHWMKKYTNLIKELVIIRPEQVWVSDITYVRLVNQWGYLSLITDAYSRRIMGFSFRQDLSAEGCLDALKMALNNRLYDQPLIHHSDRGSQYCSHKYVDLLLQNNIAISMTENGDPYENALAERINGIIKSEFNLYSSVLGFENTKALIAKSIKNYNELRPHASCDYLTPEQAHLTSGSLNKRWKNYKRNFNPQVLSV
ncbi:MAG: IS3 family transposase [Bacteroidota bacterium]|uniref:IS3 family transposase n=1 Tax=unclassified Leeuwenhoekiella TaxID=2615029 RepID=UPI0014309D7D|nr:MULTISPECIES: IS3 family transposase [unclassified Leeuwenhoekiella]MEE3149182.1 IS3 family transposase [Bacteroidota bacterium]|tara:strand:- start:990 stop:1892 length:903 start_codon:yes stop_codon:yes gene_type:complete